MRMGHPHRTTWMSMMARASTKLLSGLYPRLVRLVCMCCIPWCSPTTLAVPGTGIARSNNEKQFLYINGRPVDIPKVRACGAVTHCAYVTSRACLLLLLLVSSCCAGDQGRERGVASVRDEEQACLHHQPCAATWNVRHQRHTRQERSVAHRRTRCVAAARMVATHAVVVVLQPPVPGDCGA